MIEFKISTKAIPEAGARVDSLRRMVAVSVLMDTKRRTASVSTSRNATKAPTVAMTALKTARTSKAATNANVKPLL